MKKIIIPIFVCIFCLSNVNLAHANYLKSYTTKTYYSNFYFSNTSPSQNVCLHAHNSWTYWENRGPQDNIVFLTPKQKNRVVQGGMLESALFGHIRYIIYATSKQKGCLGYTKPLGVLNLGMKYESNFRTLVQIQCLDMVKGTCNYIDVVLDQ